MIPSATQTPSTTYKVRVKLAIAKLGECYPASEIAPFLPLAVLFTIDISADMECATLCRRGIVKAGPPELPHVLKCQR